MGKNELVKDLPLAEGRRVPLGTRGVVHTLGARGSRQRNARQSPRWSLEIWVQILTLELGSFLANERLTLCPSWVPPLQVKGAYFMGPERVLDHRGWGG